MLAQGVPIVYYGTEQNLLGHQPKAAEIRIQRGKRESFFCFHFGKKVMKIEKVDDETDWHNDMHKM